MKQSLIILSFILCLFSCSKSDIISDNTKSLQDSNKNSSVDTDSLVRYVAHFTHAPRNVNYLWAMTGSCLPSTEYKNGYILNASTSFNNKYSYDEFTISIQTSNTPLEYNLNTFNGRPACFKFGEYAWTMLDYLDKKNELHAKVLDSVKRRITINPNPDSSLDGGATEPAIFYEYRNDIVENIIITADIPLFGRKKGEDLSDKFDIVLFYMNAIGQPTYMISPKTGNVDYMISKGLINHKGDNNQSSFVGSNHYNLYGNDTTDAINFV